MVYVGASDTEAPLMEDESKQKAQKVDRARSEKWLVRANLFVAFFVHFPQAILLALFAKGYAVQLFVYYSTWVPQDPNYSCFDTLPSGEKNVCSITQTRAQASSIDMKALTVAFFLLSWAFQSFPLLTEESRKTYLDNVRNGTQIYRYVEYSISASLMIVQFAVLVGVDDVNVVMNLFWASAAIMILGFCTDTIDYYQRKTGVVQSKWDAIFERLLPCLVAWFVFLFQWIYVGSRFGYSIKMGVDVPTELYAILFLEFGLFFAFGVNAAAASLPKPGSVIPDERMVDRVTSEWVYVFLSAIAKTLLAEILFLSYNMRKSDLLTYSPLCPGS